MARVRVELSGCWTWLGARTGKCNEYGAAQIAGHYTTAHRAMFLACSGVIPAGLELDHTCRNKLCVNPAHLEPVTRLENERRKVRTPQSAFRCGHPFTPDNKYVLTNGKPYCRECQLARCRRRYAA